MVKTISSCILIVLAAIGSAFEVTDGFAAFTTEGARRLEVIRAPRPVPLTALTDSTGAEIVLGGTGQKVTLVEFIYASCPTICVALGEAYFRAQTRIARDPRLQDVNLLSISFDLARDTQVELDAYARAHGSRTPTWRIVQPSTRDELASLLTAFGIIVIDDGYGGYIHNASVHKVGRDGRISRIGDRGEIDEILDELAEAR